MADSNKPAGAMLGIIIVILITYLIYILMLHPWERKALLTEISNLTINVFDCNSSYPINNAKVSIYSTDGTLLLENYTQNGKLFYSTYPECLNIVVSFDNNEKSEILCLGSGEQRSINFCFEYPYADPHILYYNNYIGFIGNSSKEIVSVKEFNNVVLSYPENQTFKNYSSTLLYTNIFWSDHKNFTLEDTQGITKEIVLNLDVERKGNPTLIISANGKTIYSGKDEHVNLKIPGSLINGSVQIQAKCVFDGLLFWTYQYCNLTNISLERDYYIPIKQSQEYEFSVNDIEKQADSIKLYFISSTNSGGIVAKINNITIFNSDMLKEGEYSSTAFLSQLNLSLKNTLKFEAKPGTNAWLRGVKLYFNAPSLSYPKKKLSFTSKIVDTNTTHISFYVKNIFISGKIMFKLNDIVYEENVKKLGWNKLYIDSSDLKKENTLEIYAQDGSFEIGALKIAYE